MTDDLGAWISYSAFKFFQERFLYRIIPNKPRSGAPVSQMLHVTSVLIQYEDMLSRFSIMLLSDTRGFGYAQLPIISNSVVAGFFQNNSEINPFLFRFLILIFC